MYSFCIAGIIIVSILSIIATMMQPQKQQDALNALSGSSLTSQGKKRGFEAFMEKVTSVLLALFFIFALALAWLSAH